MDELPQGTVTFLFTDIEGSTRLLKQLRERYVVALGDHQLLLRRSFDQHGGHEIDTQGDSFFVAFRRAKDAVAAAVVAQRELAAHAWPDGGHLRVRMGIHTGEPVAAGERYVGVGVHRAARICAAGHGGQVLVSQATRELLRDDPLPGVSLRDLGEHQLKDLDEPERLYQLVAPGLEESFPPLKTTAPTPFDGRESELAEAAAAEFAPGRRGPARRTLVAATFGAAVIGTVAGVLLTRGGGSSARASVAANSVGVIDARSGEVADTVAVGTSPGSVAAGEGAVWVSNTDDNTVSRIDPDTHSVVQTIQVGGGPVGIAAGEGAVWVANGFDGTVSRIDPQVNRSVQTIRVGNGPFGVAYGSGRVWATNSVDGTVSEIAARSGDVLRSIPVVPGAAGVAFGFGRVWVASPSTGTVVALDPASGTVVDRIPVGANPTALAVGSGYVWVANSADGTLSEIEPQAPAHVAAAVAVGRDPRALATDGTGIWVANSTTLERVDVAQARVVSKIELRNPPQGVAVAGDGIYATVRSNGLEHRGGTLRVRQPPPDTLDPAIAYTSEAWSILSMTNDGLVTFRRVGGIEGVQLVPDLAVALPTPTDDGTTYTFRLRAGVRYSTGRPVQPADIRRGLERVFEAKPESPARPYFTDLRGGNLCTPGRPCTLSRGIVVNERARTVTFHLTQPDGDFLTKLALPFAVAVPPGVAALPNGNRPLPATGPYMISSPRKGRVVLVRNARFRPWSSDAQPPGYPDRLLFTSVGLAPDSVGAVEAVERGLADVVSAAAPLSKAQLGALAARAPAQLHVTPSTTTMMFFLNTTVRPFDDVRARQAVNLALDRQAFAATLGPGYTPTCQVLPPNYPSYRRTCPYGAGGAAAYTRARALVRASGRSGAVVTVWVPKELVIQGRMIVSVLAAVGFHPRLNVISDTGAYFQRIQDPQTHAQIGFNGWAADFPSVTGYLPPLFRCGADPGGNESRFCDHRVDELFARAEAAQARDPASAPAMWQAAERAILAKAPVVPTVNPADVSFVARRVGNYQYNPQLRVLLDQLWVK